VAEVVAAPAGVGEYAVWACWRKLGVLEAAPVAVGVWRAWDWVSRLTFAVPGVPPVFKVIGFENSIHPAPSVVCVSFSGRSVAFSPHLAAACGDVPVAVRP
jgi:hypothetical protein